MNEDVLAAIVGTDEPETLLRIVPFYGTANLSFRAVGFGTSRSRVRGKNHRGRASGRRSANLDNFRDQRSLLTLLDPNDQPGAFDDAGSARSLKGPNVKEGLGAVSRLDEANPFLSLSHNTSASTTARRSVLWK